MGIGTLFWVLFVIALVLHIWAVWPIGRPAGVLLIWVLLFLLGWRTFGFIVRNDDSGAVRSDPPVVIERR